MVVKECWVVFTLLLCRCQGVLNAVELLNGVLNGWHFGDSLGSCCSFCVACCNVICLLGCSADWPKNWTVEIFGHFLSHSKHCSKGGFLCSLLIYSVQLIFKNRVCVIYASTLCFDVFCCPASLVTLLLKCENRGDILTTLCVSMSGVTYSWRVLRPVALNQ